MAAECKTYNSFLELHEQIESRYRCLDQGQGLQIDDKSRMEFLRGGIVAMMAAWESYVHDLLNEAFDVFVDVCSGPEKSLKCLEARWPACRDIIKKAIKSERAYEVLEETDEKLQKFWIELLNMHRCNILNESTFQPVFNYVTDPNEDEAMTIDKVFRCLFDYRKKALSEKVVEVAPPKHFFLYPNKIKVILAQTREPGEKDDRLGIKALHKISCLYYGLRCVFVDGKKEKALNGVLHKLLDQEFLLPLQENREESSQIYITLYNEIQQKGRNLEVDYMTFLSVADFIRFAAECLKDAVAVCLYNLQHKNRKVVWDLPPRQL